MDGLAILPFFGLNGPQFLLAYALIAGGALLGLWAYLRFAGSDDAAPPMPARPDPYELAYLRGGWREVAAVALYGLNRAGLVDLNATTGSVALAQANARGRDPVEAAVIRAIGSGLPIKTLVRSRILRDDFESVLAPMINRLRAEGLAKPEGAGARSFALGLLVVGVLVAYAVARIGFSLAHGHSNVGFLVAEAIGTAIIALFICSTAADTTATARGQAYLGQFRLAYSGGGATQPDSGSGAFGNSDAMQMAMVAALGFGILAGTSEAAFATAYQAHIRPQGSGGDGGSSCSSGGGDGGGGGGCGGCGGCGGGGD